VGVLDLWVPPCFRLLCRLGDGVLDVGCHFCAKDCYDGVVTLIYAFLCCDVPNLLLLSICCLPSLGLAVLLGAYVPLGLLELAVLCIDMFVLPRALLLASLV
jgi:hypothetical protein